MGDSPYYDHAGYQSSECRFVLHFRICIWNECVDNRDFQKFGNLAAESAEPYGLEHGHCTDGP